MNKVIYNLICLPNNRLQVDKPTLINGYINSSSADFSRKLKSNALHKFIPLTSGDAELDCNVFSC